MSNEDDVIQNMENSFSESDAHNAITQVYMIYMLAQQTGFPEQRAFELAHDVWVASIANAIMQQKNDPQ